MVQHRSKSTTIARLAPIIAGLLTAAALAVLLVTLNPVLAEPKAPPCTEDAMIVFDASGSMAGNLDQGIATLKPRIDEVRSALAEILPTVARVRRVGLITYGPGPYQQCNVKLDLKPTANAADVIMREVNSLIPSSPRRWRKLLMCSTIARGRG